MTQEPKFEEFDVKYINEGKVAVLAFNRPKKLNSLAFEHFAQLRTIIEHLGRAGSDVRAIVLTGVGKHFTSGLDLSSAMKIGEMGNSSEDPARAAY